MARLSIESLEGRDMPSASPLPVLLVIADQQFFYQEYNDTRNSLQANGVPVVVAATTTSPSTPHPNTGQGAGVSGTVTPQIALGNVNSSEYSAIAFVGGWGSSMYQYAYNDPDLNGVNDNFYHNAFYNGDANLHDGVIAPRKEIVNNLINDFLAQDKPVAGVCHGVTVLGWARVNGVSPLAGKTIAVPLTDGTPGMRYNGVDYAAGYALGQFIQTPAWGAVASPVSGQFGNPATVADDVVVDGRIITAENNHSAAFFGTVIAQQVIAAANPTIAETSIVVNDGAVQRSRVTSVTVTFNSPVNPIMLSAPGAVTLTRGNTIVQTGAIGANGRILVSAPMAGNTQFTLTFDNANGGAVSAGVERGSLSDGVWTLRIPSFNVTAEVVRLYGDSNGDSTVDGADLAVFGNAFGTATADYDSNGDNIIDGADLTVFGNRFGTTL
jgi:putative intracellular protease/amidase